MPRITKLTPALEAEIATRVEMGATIPAAAAASGISWRTVEGWLARGKKHKPEIDSVREAEALVEEWKKGKRDDERRAEAVIALRALRVELADVLDRETRYVDFVERMDRAKLTFENNAVINITMQGQGPKGDWKALAWLLERRRPETYYKPERPKELEAGPTTILVYPVPMPAGAVPVVTLPASTPVDTVGEDA